MVESVQTAGIGLAPEVRRAIVIRKVKQRDIDMALLAGLSDFRTAPRFGLVVGGLHVAIGWMAILFTLSSGLHAFAYPLLTGLALVTPFSAAALYEVSRMLERGEQVSWSAERRSLLADAGHDLGWMCLVSLFGFIIWVDFAGFLYLAFYGLQMPDLTAFAQQLLTTPKGLLFLGVGNFFGALIAFALFSITVVSYPLLVDRDVDFVTAMMASIKAVKTNPVQMLSWAGFIAFALALGVMTGLLGLIVVLPLLGHASWHVYRAAVEPEPQSASAAD